MAMSGNSWLRERTFPLLGSMSRRLVRLRPDRGPPGAFGRTRGSGNGRKIEAQDFGTDDLLGICGIKVNLYACRTLPGSGVFLYLKQASPIISIFFFSGVWVFVILLCPAGVLLLLGTPLSLRFVMDTYLFLGGVTPMDGGNVDCNSYHAVCIFRDPPK